jgi:predicted DNA-binding ribbon-helix-helix protein
MKLDRRRAMPIKSLVVKQSVSIKGRHSSVSLEGAFWNALKEVAVAQNITAAALVSKIDSERERKAANLSSAIRVYVVEYYRFTAYRSATGMTGNGEAQATARPADDARQHARDGRCAADCVMLERCLPPYCTESWERSCSL